MWHEPVGVVGAIVPWNFPFEVTINKLAQALARQHRGAQTRAQHPVQRDPAGPADQQRATPTSPPASSMSMPASDHFVGEELTLSPKVDMHDLIHRLDRGGTTDHGKGAATMKRLFLELGGKSATIVLDDADFNTACLLGIGPLMHAGQGCAAPTRMLLPRSRYDEGVAILQTIYANMFAGDPGPRHAVRSGDLGPPTRPHPGVHP